MLCTVIRVESSSSEYFLALAPATDAALDASQQESTPASVIMVGRWLYASGVKPRAETPEGISAAAQGSKLVLHRVPAAGGQPARIRAILLETAVGRGATMYAPGETSSTFFTESQYVDAKLTSGGAFDSFDGPYPFNPESTPGSVEIVEEIETEKVPRNVP